MASNLCVKVHPVVYMTIVDSYQVQFRVIFKFEILKDIIFDSENILLVLVILVFFVKMKALPQIQEY